MPWGLRFRPLPRNPCETNSRERMWAVAPPSFRLFVCLFLSSGLLALTSSAFATDYYISSAIGSDANSGLSPDSPWQFIARANHSLFLPGDRVLLHAGESWREQLRTPS